MHSQNLVSVQNICQWALSVLILWCFILSSAVLKIFELVHDHYSQIEIYTVKMVTGWWIKCCHIDDEYIFLFRAIWGVLSNWQRSNLKTFCCSFYRNATALLILKSDIGICCHFNWNDWKKVYDFDLRFLPGMSFRDAHRTVLHSAPCTYPHAVPFRPPLALSATGKFILGCEIYIEKLQMWPCL